MLMNLYKTFNKENVINQINNLNISNIENDLFEIIDDIIDDIKYNYDEIFYIDDVIELFDIENELKLYLNNEIYDNNNKIHYEFYDDVLYLINNYDDDIIVENDVDEFKYLYDVELKFDNFNYYNSNDDLIRYNSSIDIFNTINYYDIDKYFYVDEIVENILLFENV